MTTRAPKHHTYHVHDRFYYLEDSQRGIQTAVDKGYQWIDLDCHTTADGVLVIGHGPRPLSRRLTGGFIDPGCQTAAGEHGSACQPVERWRTFEDLTWAQVSRLRSKATPADGKPYRISRADVLVPLALSKGLRVELEVKSAKITARQLRDLAAKVIPHTWPEAMADCVQVKGFPQFLPALHAASRAGYTTIVLTHPGHRRVPVGPDRWRPDYFRGMRPIWTGAGR